MMKGTYTHRDGTVENLYCEKTDMDWAMDEVADYALDHALDGEWDENKGLRDALLILGSRIKAKFDSGSSPRIK